MTSHSPTMSVRMVDHMHIYSDSADPEATVDFYAQNIGAEADGIVRELASRVL